MSMNPSDNPFGTAYIAGKIGAIFDEARPPGLARHQAQIPKLLILRAR